MKIKMKRQEEKKRRSGIAAPGELKGKAMSF